MARIPYAPTGARGSDHPLNLIRMMAHSPPVLSGFSKLGGAILTQSALAPRLREIAILRVGLVAGADYEVSKHVAMGRSAGLEDDEIAALRPDGDVSVLGEAERAVVRFTDELVTAVRASDDALAGVRRHLGDRELVELVVTIGYYGLVCRVLETLGVDLERDRP